MMNLQNIGPPIPKNVPRGSSVQLQGDKFDLESKPDFRVDDKPKTASDRKPDVKKGPKTDIRFDDKPDVMAKEIPEITSDDQFDVKVKTFEKARVPEQKSKGEVATHKFMDSMESELGVTPEKILVAMAAMKPKELAEPVSVTSESFVNNLNLEQAARPKAFQLYNQLLVDKGVLAPLEPGSLVMQMNVNPLQESLLAKQNVMPPSAMQLDNSQVGAKAANAGLLKEMQQGAFDQQAIQSASTSGNIANLANAQLAIEGLPIEMFDASSEASLNAAQNANLNTFANQSGSLPKTNLQAELNPKANIDPQTNLSARASLSPNAEFDPEANLVPMDEDSTVSDVENVDSEDTNLSDSDIALMQEQSDDNSDGVYEQNRLNPSAAKAKGNSKTDSIKAGPLNSFERRQKLNESIDKMNDSFFMNAQIQKKAAQQAVSESAQKTILPFDRRLDQPRSLVDEVQALKQNEVLGMPEQQIVRSPMLSDSFENSTARDFESEMDEAEFENSALSKKDSDFQSQVYGKLNSEWQPNNLSAVKAEPGLNSLQMNNVDKVKNMQKLFENAKILTQNGGGEMQMKLSPEGLGDLQLKVVVANGKVDLELKTQNHEVKKMMESTISELKSSLAHHSLSIDNVKVDVATQDNNSSGDSFMKQFQMNDNREQARQFLGQFRENNFSQRNNMFDVPGFKSYQSQRGEDLQPVSNQPVRPRKMDVNKGQGLNLVA
jgi:hypothetical protein